jgi:hypothetical protein
MYSKLKFLKIFRSVKIASHIKDCEKYISDFIATDHLNSGPHLRKTRESLNFITSRSNIKVMQIFSR